MKTSSLVKLFGCALGVALTLAAPASAGAEEWRIATLAPDGSAWMKVLSVGADEIKSATAGRVTLKYYPGGVQGDEKEAVSKMQLGQLDGSALTSTGLSMIDESIRVLELPALFASPEELDYVRGKMWPTFRARFEKKGFKLGEPGDVGFFYIYSNSEVKSLADLGKVKMWLWAEDKIGRALFKKLNVNGVPMGVPDVMTALNTGRIDACYGSPLSTVALQWYTKVKFATAMPISYGIGASAVRVDKWNKVSAEDQTTIQKVLKAQAAKLRKTIRKDNLRALKSITRGGVKIVDSSPAMVAEFEKVAQAIWKEQAGKVYSQDDLDKVLKYRDEFRKGAK
jgi:TRAP-type C4-dicarboxylate transport system substrate-binding protein